MEAEKQEGQKTVISFITGLLIGGLLVWVFTSSPEDAQKTTVVDDTNTSEAVTNDSTNVSKEDEKKAEGSVTVKTSETKSNATTPAVTVTPKNTTKSEGSLDVKSQPAGAVVVLSDTTFPGTDGWIAVRDYVDGQGGRILGAARYATNDGLIPTSINLLRSTEAGKTYQVVFYSENGDRVFDPKEDVLLGGETTFKAE